MGVFTRTPYNRKMYVLCLCYLRESKIQDKDKHLNVKRKLEILCQYIFWEIDFQLKKKIF